MMAAQLSLSIPGDLESVATTTKTCPLPSPLPSLCGTSANSVVRFSLAK
jgi:hypothetical protein